MIAGAKISRGCVKSQIICDLTPPIMRAAPQQSASFFDRSFYPWRQNIVTTVFWPGELPTATDPGNLQSAFDPYWLENAPHEPPFFFALPYVDIEAGHTKSEASTVIPWLKTAFFGTGKSVLEGRWTDIYKDGRVAYATWGDVGSAHTDDWQYVFGNQPPRLQMSEKDVCSWRFCEEREVPPGPWVSFNNGLVRK